jgi:hypothetical protein
MYSIRLCELQDIFNIIVIYKIFLENEWPKRGCDPFRYNEGTLSSVKKQDV